GAVGGGTGGVKAAFRAVLCATDWDWERFDKIFDAYWLGHDVHQARVLAGSAFEGRAPGRHLKDAGPPAGTPGFPDRSERRHDVEDDAADGRGKREGASRFENLAGTDLRHILDAADIAEAHALAARLSRVMRARVVRRERVRRR